MNSIAGFPRWTACLAGSVAAGAAAGFILPRFCPHGSKAGVKGCPLSVVSDVFVSVLTVFADTVYKNSTPGRSDFRFVRRQEEMENATPHCSSPTVTHHIGVLMSQTGRYLECVTCRLSFPFPPGERYDTIAKQFEGCLCQTAAQHAKSRLSEKLGEK